MKATRLFLILLVTFNLGFVGQVLAQGEVIVTSNSTSCVGCCDGSATLLISGCAPDFTVTWTGPGTVFSTDIDLSDICAGDYSVTVTDSNDNAVTTEFTVDEMNGSTTVTDNFFCPGYGGTAALLLIYNPDNMQSNGEACVYQPPCWSGPVDFSWTDANGVVIATSSCISNFSAGTYTLLLTSVDDETIYFEFFVEDDGSFNTLEEEACIIESTVESALKKEFGLYPNPSLGIVHVSAEAEFTLLTVHIYDTQGRLVLIENISSDKRSIDLSHCDNGLYHVQLTRSNGELITTSKVILTE